MANPLDPDRSRGFLFGYFLPRFFWRKKGPKSVEDKGFPASFNTLNDRLVSRGLASSERYCTSNAHFIP
jgi:hypothetical protein